MKVKVERFICGDSGPSYFRKKTIRFLAVDVLGKGVRTRGGGCWRRVRVEGREENVFKGQCYLIFGFIFFSLITFPQAPENDIRVISNFFGDIPKSRCTTGINDKGVQTK